MNEISSTRKSPVIFFILVFALSSLFWMVGALTRLQLLPGVPVSAFSSFCPMIAALILVYRENKSSRMARLLKGSIDYKRIKAKVWLAPTILFWPGVMVLSYGVMRLMGSPVPAPQFPLQAPILFFFLFFIEGLGEELGWSGYVIELIQDRHNALQSSLLLGLVWAVWHLVLLMQAQRTPEYILWQSFTYLAERVLFVWLYNNTGKSVFATVVFHAMLNVTWQLFPIDGSFYDPRITGLIVAFAAVFVTFLWGAKTLAQYRFTRPEPDERISTTV